MRTPEILAPAGSMDALTAALRSGADAVYVGGKRYSARNNAANFSLAELEDAAYQCHIHGAKLYLAVNTLISDTEACDFCEYIKSAATLGVDGFIVQDTGAAEIMRQTVPTAELHASTQMSIHTAAGIRELKKMGFSRAVPARELSADALKRLCDEDIEIEVFVHGALCMSVSGQCYMSAMIGSRSANRGCCGQACRLPFSAVGKRDFSALSLKDLSLLEHTDKLCEIGVDSLKIEGRMKRPEYIAAASAELKKALDGTAPDMKLLRDIFSRSGFTDGYFSGKRQNMFGIREKDDVLAAKDVIPKLHELYRSERKSFTVDYHCVVMPEQPIKIKATCGAVAAEVTGDIPEKAKNAPTTVEMLSKQLSKLGDTVFSLGKITAELGENLFVTAGKLNELRRLVIDKLEKMLANANKPKHTVTSFIPELSKAAPPCHKDDLPVRTFCRTSEQAVAAAELSEFVIIPENLITPQLTEKISAEKIIVSPPRFIVDENKTFSRLAELKKIGLERIICHTLDTAAMGKELGYKLHGSFTMNMFNSYSAEYLRKFGFEDCIASPEMTVSQLEKLCTSLTVGAVIYGRLPLMLTRNCPIKNEVGCKKCTGQLIDRTSRRLPVACSKDYVEILNPDVIYMADRISELRNIAFGAILLGNESADEVRSAVLCRKPSVSITRGLYYRGVCENT